jgi:hypothetical protein
VRWSFGDGTHRVGGYGEAHPTRSTIRHGYTQHGRVTVRADLDLVPRYRIAGTDWVELPTIPVTDAQPYRVREAQAVVSG